MLSVKNKIWTLPPPDWLKDQRWGLLKCKVNKFVSKLIIIYLNKIK